MFSCSVGIGWPAARRFTLKCRSSPHENCHCRNLCSCISFRSRTETFMRGTCRAAKIAAYLNCTPPTKVTVCLFDLPQFSQIIGIFLARIETDDFLKPKLVEI